MMCLAHIYAACEVTGIKDPLLAYGSFFPDAHLAGFTAARRIHREPQEYKKLIDEKYPELKMLASGVMLHCEKSKGLDYYSDDTYMNGIGYSDLPRKAITDFIISTPSLSIFSEKIRTQLSHAAREFGVDLLLNDERKELAELFKRSVTSLPNDAVARSMAEFCHTGQTDALDGLEMFNKKLSLKSYDINFLIAALYDMGKNYSKICIDKSPLSELILIGKDTVKDDYKEFLSYAIEHMKNDFKVML